MGVAEGSIPIIPDAVEAEDMSVMVQELLEGVTFLIRAQRLHSVVKLRRDQSNDQ